MISETNSGRAQVKSTEPRARGSLLQVPWFLVVAVVRTLTRQLDDQQARRLTQGM